MMNIKTFALALTLLSTSALAAEMTSESSGRYPSASGKPSWFELSTGLGFHNYAETTGAFNVQTVVPGIVVGMGATVPIIDDALNFNLRGESFTRSLKSAGFTGVNLSDVSAEGRLSVRLVSSLWFETAAGYKTMFVDQDTFGYRNLGLIQAGLRVGETHSPIWFAAQAGAISGMGLTSNVVSARLGLKLTGGISGGLGVLLSAERLKLDIVSQGLFTPVISSIRDWTTQAALAYRL
jgi:hypothetical protein